MNYNSCRFEIHSVIIKHKKQNMKLKTFCSPITCALLIITSILTFSACSKDDNTPDNEIKFSASLDQSQETPPTGATATGTCEARYNTETNLLTYTLTWTGLTAAPTAMHFHKAEFGEPGDVEIPITGFAVSPGGTLSSSATVDEDEEEDLLENKFYVNIHTAAHPGGEIRGQLIKK